MDLSWSSITNGTDIFHKIIDSKETVQVQSGPLSTLSTLSISFKQG